MSRMLAGDTSMKKILAAGVLLCCLAAAAGTAFFLPKEKAFRAAVRLQEEGDEAGAYREYARLKGWRDSRERMRVLEERFPQLPLQGTEKWDAVTFGTCEQDGDPADGPEPLEWYVLYRGDAETGGTDLLLLSRACLFCRAFHEPVMDISWEDCTLRAFLNETFYEESFTVAQKNLIRKDPAAPDRIFLLDSREMAVYFPREEDRWLYARAQATQEAVREGILLSGQGEEEMLSNDPEADRYAGWWLRSPGNEAYSAQVVEEDGTVYEAGAAVDIDYLYGVRPALWVHLDDS